jgi:hypothetical protein
LPAASPPLQTSAHSSPATRFTLLGNTLIEKDEDVKQDNAPSTIVQSAHHRAVRRCDLTFGPFQSFSATTILIAEFRTPRFDPARRFAWSDDAPFIYDKQVAHADRKE